MTDLQALIRDLEAAPADAAEFRALGDRVLLAAGWDLIDKPLLPHIWVTPNGNEIPFDSPKVPNPCVSVDAALALVDQDKWDWGLGRGAIYGCGTIVIFATLGERGTVGQPFEGNGTTPALSLCIVWAKAKMAEGDR